ncbi:hypothetical protein [Dokdonella sp.]|uniref:hypothetical protein n=1 Tax=Dokdonella sp. TaxID=2291710 RepID=UPI003529A9B6
MSDRLSASGNRCWGYQIRFAVVLSVLLLAACSRAMVRDEGIDPPCLPGAPACTPEIAATLSRSEIALVGSTLTVSCGVSESGEKSAALSQCSERSRRMLHQLSNVMPTIDPFAHIDVEEARTCIDTFISGREAADCEFHAISARVSLDGKLER